MCLLSGFVSVEVEWRELLVLCEFLLSSLVVGVGSGLEVTSNTLKWFEESPTSKVQ